MTTGVGPYISERLASYGLPDHPCGTDRQGACWREAQARDLDRAAAWRHVLEALLE